jgi:hypothetical protein
MPASAKTVRHIRIMADYFCSPVWHDGPYRRDAAGHVLPDPSVEVGPIELDDLPVSEDLRDDLEAWADRFDATLDEDDPARSGGFEAPDSLAASTRDGAALAARVAAELGPDWVVRYVPPAG